MKSNPLELTETDERPECIPEGIWPLVKREMILSRAGVVKSSNRQSAEKFGIAIGDWIRISSSKKWRREVEEFREQMAQKCMIASDRVADALVTDLDDEEKVAKMSIRDKAIVTKQLSENVLNLSNGMVGSPALGISFNDVKVLLGTAIEKPIVASKKA